jgi:hypothetical protein
LEESNPVAPAGAARFDPDAGTRHNGA